MKEMSPPGNVKSPENKVKTGKKRSQLRRWLFQFLGRIGSCCGRAPQVPDELEVRGQLLRRCTETPDAFQLLLRERKLEVKLEAKEQIAGMMSKTGIHPRQLFPTEIWVKILQHVPPEGLANMLKIHDFLLDLILAENYLIQDILLPVMLDFKLPIVHRHLLLPIYKGFRWRLGKHDLSQLLLLRRVCKSLRDSVDRWIESRLLHLMRTSEYADRSFLHSIAHNELSYADLEIDTCSGWKRLSRIHEYSRGPESRRPKQFILRSLNIGFCCQPCSADTLVRTDAYTEGHGIHLKERFPVFKDSITEFLHTVGDQIMHIKVVLASESHFVKYGVSMSQEEINDILREWLSLLPNLIWLQIDASKMDAPPKEQQKKITMQNPRSVMPLLRKLERFDFNGCGDDDPLWHSIVDTNPRISRINVINSLRYRDFYQDFDRDRDHDRSYQRYLANGKAEVDAYKDPSVLRFPLEVAHFGRREVKRWDFAMLKQVHANHWNLKRLTLWINWRTRPHSMDHVLRGLQIFQSLEDLEIHLESISRDFKIGESFLLLPNLKHFKFELRDEPKLKSIKDGGFFFSLMFLLECKKLESLDWENEIHDTEPFRRQLEQRMENMQIGFMGGFADLCESNIWDVFPKLRRIRTRHYLPQKHSGWDKNCEYLERKYHNRKLVGEKKIKWIDTIRAD